MDIKYLFKFAIENIKYISSLPMLPSSQFINLKFIQLTKTSTIIPPSLPAAFFPFLTILVLLEPWTQNHNDKLFKLWTAKSRR
jgi:hypothetical protein